MTDNWLTLFVIALRCLFPLRCSNVLFQAWLATWLYSFLHLFSLAEPWGGEWGLCYKKLGGENIV